MLKNDYLWRPWFQEDSLPIHLVHGEGCFVVDRDGKRYLDAQAAFSGASCGYGAGPVADAAMRQMNAIQHYPLTQTVIESTIKFSEKLSEILPEKLKHTFLCASGSEAVETAIKMARGFHFIEGNLEKNIIISLENSYHGATFGALSATRLSHCRKGYEPLLEGFIEVPSPCSRHQETKSSLERTLQHISSNKVAGIIIELVQGVGGIHPIPNEYLKAICDACLHNDVLVIFDEVMTGMGRTGKWFALEHFGIVPDIVLASKGLTSGYFPLSSITASEKIYSTFKEDPIFGGFRHGHTYSGHAAACAAGVATIEYIQQNELIHHGYKMGIKLMDNLSSILLNKKITDVRGLGLLVGVEVDNDETARVIHDSLQEDGILTRRQRNVLSIAPPLIITEEQIDLISEAMISACDALNL